MHKDLKDYRKSYEKGELLEKDIPYSPFQLFTTWFEMAEDSLAELEANAMTLSTVDEKGNPNSRVVLLKSYDQDGFKFFTNYESGKGKDLSLNPNCCISFFWHGLEKQVIIKGKASKLSEEESEEYFQSRPRGSRLGAIASNQSTVISSRDQLEDKLKKLELEYKDKEIPKPEYWGGYLISPESIEFWQGRKNRLHDRIIYRKVNGNWKYERLAP